MNVYHFGTSQDWVQLGAGWVRSKKNAWSWVQRRRDQMHASVLCESGCSWVRVGCGLGAVSIFRLSSLASHFVFAL